MFTPRSERNEAQTWRPGRGGDGAPNFSIGNAAAPRMCAKFIGGSGMATSPNNGGAVRRWIWGEGKLEAAARGIAAV